VAGHDVDFNWKPHLQRRGLYRNFNNIRVRSFILTGAPVKSMSYPNRWKARETQTHHRPTNENGWRLNGGTIHLPGRLKDGPDRDRLALRFERFKAVA
jgi:hypothetical protein